MKRLLMVYACLLVSSLLCGQSTKILEENEDFDITEKTKDFYYIEKEFPVNNDRWVATLEGFCINKKGSTLENLFYDFWEKANSMGANSFYVEEVSNLPDTIFVVIAIFKLTEKELDENYDLYPCNKLYVFSDLINSTKGRKFKFNNEKITLYPLKYYSCQNQIGGEVSISVGGFLGSKYVSVGKEGKQSIYLTFSGMGVSPFSQGGMVGFSMNTGSLQPLEMNFGQFLVEVLSEEN
jgi:hypothetical protein